MYADRLGGLADFVAALASLPGLLDRAAQYLDQVRELPALLTPQFTLGLGRLPDCLIKLHAQSIAHFAYARTSLGAWSRAAHGTKP